MAGRFREMSPWPTTRYCAFLSHLQHEYVTLISKGQICVSCSRMDKLIIERDVPITMDDGLILRADVFRPKDGTPCPVVMTQGVYGKGVPYRDAFAPQWKVLMSEKPEVHRNSSKEFMVWETVDPETWVPYGYAVIRVD